MNAWNGGARGSTTCWALHETGIRIQKENSLLEKMDTQVIVAQWCMLWNRVAIKDAVVGIRQT